MRIFISVLQFFFGILAAIGFFFGGFDKFEPEQKISLLFLCSVVFILATIALLIEFKVRREQSRYSVAIPKISIAISKFIGNYREEKMPINITQLLDEVSEIYKELKGAKCCLTIKNVSIDKDINTYTRSRNAEGEKKREEHLPNGILKLEHALSVSSDLNKIYSQIHSDHPRDVYFFSKNLLFGDYNHPALNNEYKLKLKRMRYLLPKFVRKYILWPIPFKSTIVVPIMAMTRLKGETNRLKIPNGHFAGTLCIYSDKFWVFNKKLDITLLQVLSEVIHVFVTAEKLYRIKLAENSSMLMESEEIKQLRKQLSEFDRDLKEREKKIIEEEMALRNKEKELEMKLNNLKK